jgi:hypothetical protein
VDARPQAAQAPQEERKEHMSRPPGSGVTPLRERFARFISPEPNTGCLLWAGAMYQSGYGSFSVRRSTNDRAPRVAWRLVNGSIPPSLDVLHHCDVRACVYADPDPRRSHLFLGTHGDNARDMARKGRQVFQQHPERAARGEKSGAAKLTERRVAEIRGSDEPCRALAKRYGVSKSLISAIRCGHIWRGA